MSVLICRVDGRTIEPVNGYARLRASLKVFGKATVTDMDTHETFDVHMVDGQIVALDDGRSAFAGTIAVAAICIATSDGVKQLLAPPKNRPYYRQFAKAKF